MYEQSSYYLSSVTCSNRDHLENCLGFPEQLESHAIKLTNCITACEILLHPCNIFLYIDEDFFKKICHL